MALLKDERKKSKLPQSSTSRCYCNSQGDVASVRNKLPKIPEPLAIDYHNLQWLCNITDHKSGDCPMSEKEAHETFMLNYRKIFASQQGDTGCPLSKEITDFCTSGQHKNQAIIARKPQNKSSRSVVPLHKNSHNIKDYLGQLHKERKRKDQESVKVENLQALRHILRKMPFERTPEDNDNIFSLLQSSDFFREKVHPAVLKHLCTVAYMETLKEENLTVYGKTGVHLILNGSVIPLSEPYVMADKESNYPQSFVTLDDLDPAECLKYKLYPGSCFGTWVLHGQPYTKEFSVQTKEPNCEFMKISASDYKLITAKMKHREHAKKLNLLVSCDQYRLWPRQPLIALADCLDWISYPSNTVLAKEGCRSSFIGFIKSGECHVLRQVHVLPDHRNGKHRTTQIVMGKLGPLNSFAEMSVLLEEPITCSIVAATSVDLGIIRPEKIKGLDEVTRQLIIQSNTRTFGYLTKEDIQNEYLKQELARKWSCFKNAQVMNIINSKISS